VPACEHFALVDESPREISNNLGDLGVLFVKASAKMLGLLAADTRPTGFLFPRNDPSHSNLYK
jgi:hypothetical protein